MKEMEMYGIGDKKVVEGTIIYIPVRAHYGYLDFGRMYEKDMITRLTPKRKKAECASGRELDTNSRFCLQISPEAEKESEHSISSRKLYLQFAHLNDIILADRKAFARMSDEEQEKARQIIKELEELLSKYME